MGPGSTGLSQAEWRKRTRMETLQGLTSWGSHVNSPESKLGGESHHLLKPEKPEFLLPVTTNPLNRDKNWIFMGTLFRCLRSEKMTGYIPSKTVLPWLVWLSGLSAGLWTKRSPVQFPVRAHAWVADQVPRWGHARGNWSMSLLHIDVSPSLSPSLPLSLKINK